MGSEIRIDPRFCGPPGSGNGGYVCGLLAAHVEGDARVRLERPPPLERALDVVVVEPDGTEPGGVELRDGEQRVAQARSAPLEIGPLPQAPSFDEAKRAAGRFRGHADHPFPSCFVCGPARTPDDGLCIFPGPVEGAETVAAPWTPDASLGDGSGAVAPEFLWAALDCPGCFSFPQPESRACVLGEFSARIEGAVAPGEPCVVVGWSIEHSGRKHRTGTALFGRDGGAVAFAVGTWIEIPRP